MAIIIGAMELAPLLGPNIGLSLASTIGGYKLAREAVKLFSESASALSFLLQPNLSSDYLI